MNLLSKMRIKIKYRLGLISFEKKLSKKWKKDCENLPLSPAQFELYKNIHHICLRKLGEFPDLINCRDFNDRIQWLKLFDQRPEIILPRQINRVI